MINRLVVCLLLFTISACQSKESTLSEQISASGLPYTFTSMPGNSRISIYIAWPTNWYFDTNTNPTVPRIATRLLLAGGSADYPAGQVIERFSDMNSEGDLWTSADYVYGVLHFSPEHQDETLAVANSHLRNPLFDQKWLERVRGQYVEQMIEYRDSAEVQGFDASRWAMFGKQPIRAGLSVREASTITAATQTDVFSWAKSTFQRKGVFISIAGDLKVADAGRAVDALFDGLPEGKDVTPGTAQIDMSPKRILLHAPESATSTLTFFGKLPPISDGSEFDDLILIEALSGGFEDGLSGAVRTELRASYHYGAGTEEYTADNRLLIMSGQVETSKIADAEKTIRKVYAQFRENPVIQELPKIKKKYEIDFKENLKDTGSVAYDALIAKIRGKNPARALNLKGELDAVTTQTLTHRLKDAFPTADELVMVLSTADENALADACVIKTAKDAIDC